MVAAPPKGSYAGPVIDDQMIDVRGEIGDIAERTLYTMGNKGEPDWLRVLQDATRIVELAVQQLAATRD